MKQKIRSILERLIDRFPELEQCRSDIEEAFSILRECYLQGNKILICGNGGSAADSEHIVGELMKGFHLKRTISQADSDKIKRVFPNEWKYLSDRLQGTLPAISLVSQTSLCSAIMNDLSSDMVFAQQVYGYGSKGDVLIGITTSGKAENVVNAVRVAKVFGLKAIGLTGKGGGNMKPLCDVLIEAPGNSSCQIQELHMPIYHSLCTMLEYDFFKD